MLKALYYPYTQIKSEAVLKNALLLWDCVETIVPARALDWGDHSTESRNPAEKKSRLWQEAEELVVQARVPSRDEKSKAHNVVASMLNDGRLAKLLLMSRGSWGEVKFDVYSEKFLYGTWARLEQQGLSKWNDAEARQEVPAVVGLVLMSALADACAGTQTQQITDQEEAYGWLANHRAALLGSQCISGLDVSQVAPSYDRLVSLSLDVVDGRKVSLAKLVAMRKRELKSGGDMYAALRRRYLKALNAHLERIAKDVRSQADLMELDRQFKDEIRDDISDLSAELRIASGKALFSKDTATSLLLAAGSMTQPIAGLTDLPEVLQFVGVVPLLKNIVEHRGARRDVLKKHSMSWLYLTKRRYL